MFGRRKRKLAEQEALQKLMEDAEANRRAQLEQEQEREAKVYYDSEIIFDEPDNHFDVQNDVPNNEPEETPVVVALPVPGEEPAKAEEPVKAEETVKPEEPVVETPVEAKEEPVKDEAVQDSEEPAEPVNDEPETAPEEDEAEDVAEESTVESEGEGDEPEIRYIVDGPTEDDELVKPAKLVKLPNLVDYMLSLNMTKRMKVNIATLLIGAYAKFKDIPEEKAIIVGCMKKVMFALMS